MPKAIQAMRFIHLARCVLVLCIIALTVPLQAAEDSAAFSMSIDEFVELSDADQKSLVASAFEHRLQHAKNLHYEALMLGNVSEYDGERVGKVLTQLNGSRLRHWTLGDSFRMDTDRGGPDVSHPQKFVVCGLDATSGVVRSTVRFNNRDRSAGRIGVEVDQINHFNRYAYWLEGEHTMVAEYVFRYLVDHRSHFTLEPASENKVCLIVPWHPYESKEPLGARTFLLDPAKGFLPVHGMARWDEVRRGGKTSWRTEEFFVEAAELVGDVWMPTQLKEVIGASTGGDGKVNVYDIKVSKIEAGTVTAEDIEVPFPMGMDVVDTIKGETYVVGPNNE